MGNQLDVPCGLKDVLYICLYVLRGSVLYIAWVLRGSVLYICCLVHLLVCPKGERLVHLLVCPKGECLVHLLVCPKGECLVHLLLCSKGECVSRSSSIDLEFDLAYALFF